MLNPMDPVPVDRWVVCIPGFRQKEGQSTGIENLQGKIHTKCSSGSTRVLLKEWRDDMAALAGRIHACRNVGTKPDVMVIGYSYGGYTAVKLCRELKKRGIRVRELLLVDAVWRPYRAFPSTLSMLKCWTITRPSNVDNTTIWHQSENKPSGHNVLDEEGLLLPMIRLTYHHEFIDESEEIHNRAMSLACPSRKEG